MFFRIIKFPLIFGATYYIGYNYFPIKNDSELFGKVRDKQNEIINDISMKSDKAVDYVIEKIK